MKQIGTGVLINRIFNRGDCVLEEFIGKTIESVSLDWNDILHFAFDDGTKMRIADTGQTCCESRYMRTDDDLTEFVGAKFLGIDLRDAPDEPGDYGDHEVQFMEVLTDKGSFVMSSHNEHNGYYSGFYIEASRE